MKSIIIIANFCRKFDGTINGRFLYLAEMLADRGFRVELVTSDFSHVMKKFKEAPVNTYKSKITYVHEPGYQNNVSIKRLYSHWKWGMNIKKYLDTRSVPDYIYCAIPSLTAALKAGKYARRHDVKFIEDIQDLWPEAFGLVIKNAFLQNVLLFPFKLYANCIYKLADKVIAVSETYKNRVLSVLGNNATGLCVFLGNDKEVFDAANLKFHVGRSDGEIWLCYIGSLSYSYDIECVIDALSIIKRRKQVNRNVKFMIIGDGPLREKFTRYANEKGIYTEFTGRLSYEKMVGLLCSCDIAINPIKKRSAGSVINKVGDYALSGLPVINTQECEEYRMLIDQYNCGINCEVGNSEDVALAIEKLVLDEKIRLQMGKQSRVLAEERFDRRKTYESIVEIFEK